MGMKVDLRLFADVKILGFAVVLTIVAILGKQVCSLGVVGVPADRLSVGIGMIPRGMPIEIAQQNLGHASLATTPVAS